MRTAMSDVILEISFDDLLFNRIPIKMSIYINQNLSKNLDMYKNLLMHQTI